MIPAVQSLRRKIEFSDIGLASGKRGSLASWPVNFYHMKAPITVSITGAAGQIGYAILFRIASGFVFGNDQPVNLRLIEIEPGLPALKGVVMELEDCAFPLLKEVVATTDLDEGFKGANWALLIGSVRAKRGWSGRICSGSTARFSPAKARRSRVRQRKTFEFWWWVTHATPTP